MKVKQVKECDGLMTCILNHEVKDTTVDYEWLGPKISQEVWDEVLAFFRWSYETTHGESQVRLYVNSITRVWKAWAYPQKGKTGISTVELTDPWGPEQFCFNDADGWMLYGTVHHHCNMSAFQSPTDQSNEQNQDGLHITVGHMAKDHYDIDARLYQSGFKLIEFDLAKFWEIRTDLAALPKFLLAMIPATQMKLIAKQEMGVPPPPDYPFPEQWKTNLVIVAPEPIRAVVTYHGYGTYTPQPRKDYMTRSANNLLFDVQRAMVDICHLIQDQDAVKDEDRVGFSEVIKMVEEIDSLLSPWHMDLADVICHHDIRPGFLAETLKVELKRLQESSKKHNGKAKGKGKQIQEAAEKAAADAEQDLMDWEGSNWRGQGFGLGG